MMCSLQKGSALCTKISSLDLAQRYINSTSSCKFRPYLQGRNGKKGSEPHSQPSTKVQAKKEQGAEVSGDRLESRFNKSVISVTSCDRCSEGTEYEGENMVDRLEHVLDRT